MRRIMKSTALVAAFLIGSQQISQSLELKIKTDDATRRAILQLPDALGVALVKSLTASMPLIDKSILLYMKTAEASLKELLRETRCVLVDGPIAEVKASIESAVNNVIRYHNVRTDPLAQISAAKEEYMSILRFNLKPEDITYIYGGLLYNIRIQYCRAIGASTGTADIINQEAEKVQSTMLNWAFIRGSCASPQDCVESRRKFVESFIAASDVRDVNSTKAKELFDGTVKPARPIEPWYIGYLPEKWRPAQDLRAHELALANFQGIELGITGALNSRIESARNAISALNQLAAAMGQSVTAASNGLSKHDLRQNNNVRAEVSRGKAIGHQVAVGLAGAKSLADSSQAVELNNIQALINRLTMDFDNILAQAQKLDEQITIDMQMNRPLPGGFVPPT